MSKPTKETAVPDGDQVPSWDEADRLSALHAYGILDAPPSDDFDDFVQIAAAICEAPIAVVNLIDENRQVFAGEIGLGVRETQLDVSICAQTILQPDVFVVPDLSLDRRFDCNPLVTGNPGLRFYGGALLETPAGLPIGTMCVLDYKPRPSGLTERQSATLRALARQVINKLELRRAVEEKELLVGEAHHRIKNSLQMLQSLLMLQARMTENLEASQLLRESAARVHTFGAMHEHLYRVGSDQSVKLAEYLGSIVEGQRNALVSTMEDRQVTFRANGAPTWPASDAPTIGLIMMELVTNALKYGSGIVGVTVRRSGLETVLTVEDEGHDLPTDYRPTADKGMGMRVMIGLLRSRRGRIEVDRTMDHTCFVVTLPAGSPRGMRPR